MRLEETYIFETFLKTTPWTGEIEIQEELYTPTLDGKKCLRELTDGIVIPLPYFNIKHVLL